MDGEKNTDVNTENIEEKSSTVKILIAVAILLFLITCYLIFVAFLKKSPVLEEEKEETREETTVKDILPTPHCPTGYSIVGDVCEKTEEEAPQTYTGCPKGSIEIGPEGPCGTYKNEGEKIKRCPPMPTIFEKEIDGKLYCYTEKRGGEACGIDPESSYLEDGSCYYHRIDSESTHSCSNGLVSYQGKCYTKAEKVNVQTCKETYTLEGNKCTRIERADQIKTCPSDYELKEDKCVKKS